MDKRIQARPFLKWAGGKTQLLAELTARLPQQIKESGVIKTYVEPFVGGGAFFFHLHNEYNIENAYLIDINRELMVGYQVVKQTPEALITQLGQLETDFLALVGEERSRFYYRIRELYNRQMEQFDYQSFNQEWIVRASFLIFLNKTCYNGLFRQNQKGEFNVPCGCYKNPTICDADNIRAVSRALQRVSLICADFLSSSPYIDRHTFVYFDPPYRPLTRTARLTSYSKESFTDVDQIRLAEYFRELNARGALLLLSNSDPKVSNPDDNFFDELYHGFNIERVLAKRNINSDGSGRGEITELIIRNY